MNIYSQFSSYIVSSLKLQRKMDIQETDLIYINKELKELKADITKAKEPGWLIVSLD